MTRLADAVSGPGIDTDSWTNMGRIDDDPDAMVWDEQLGWLVDVTFVGGKLDGEGPVLCRYSTGAANQGGRHRPPSANCYVLCDIPGDPNDDVVIVAEVHTTTDCVAPTTINGDEIVERDAEEGQVSAAETHMAVFPTQDADEEWRERRVTTSGLHRLHGENMELGVANADQPYVRGTNKADADEAIWDAFNDLLTAINTAITAASATTAGGVVIDPVSLTAFSAALEQFGQARNTYLSSRIMGD
jgi:hypothetical protein